MLIVAIAAAFIGYFAIRIFVRMLPVLLIAAGIMYVVFQWHLY